MNGFAHTKDPKFLFQLKPPLPLHNFRFWCLENYDRTNHLHFIGLIQIGLISHRETDKPVLPQPHLLKVLQAELILLVRESKLHPIFIK